MNNALLSISGLRREFTAGEENIVVLDDVTLNIEAGEMVAIVGQSGSGKSTLMNILGCLDRPTAGSYRIDGKETQRMTQDELAQLRREHFGFIFQRYHLLNDLSAIDNVEMPAIYAGIHHTARHARAKELLGRLGLSDRIGHKPGQLSGGQQQRVSIARALMNGGKVILADEPTGALDTRSGEDVMKVLRELHLGGHTIVLVTHDVAIAQHAQRIIEIKDGHVVADRLNSNYVKKMVLITDTAFDKGGDPNAKSEKFLEAFRMAMQTMNTHRLRTFLTMLGIIIGIASVVSVIALGAGAQQKILASISSLGTNTIDVFPGSGFGDLRSKKVETLKASDAWELAKQPYVDSATPNLSTTLTLLYGNQSANASVNGVGDQYFRARGLDIEQGRFFGNGAVIGLEQVVVIDQNTRKRFFPLVSSPIGKILILNNVPAKVIGVTKKQSDGFGSSSVLNVWVPYTVAKSRMLGQNHVSSITVRVADKYSMHAAEQALTRFIKYRHGTHDFYLSNSEKIRETIESTTQTMRVMIGAIAAIALVVGGIGVMNIMLVSVVERTSEIGVRMAVGARQRDIMQQFLIESVLVCLLGGLLGVAVALGLGLLLELSGIGFTLVFSLESIVFSFICSSMIGIIFGFLPARNAARLDPVEALVRE